MVYDGSFGVKFTKAQHRKHPQNHLQRCLNEATDICGMHAYICVDASLKNPLNPKFGVRTNIFEENNDPVFLCKNPKGYDRKH